MRLKRFYDKLFSVLSRSLSLSLDSPSFEWHFARNIGNWNACEVGYFFDGLTASSSLHFPFMQTSNIALNVHRRYMQIRCHCRSIHFIHFICMFFEFRNTDNMQSTNSLNTIWWAFRRLTQFSFIFLFVFYHSTSVQSIWFDRFDVYETPNIRKMFFHIFI